MPEFDDLESLRRQRNELKTVVMSLILLAQMLKAGDVDDAVFQRMIDQANRAIEDRPLDS